MNPIYCGQEKEIVYKSPPPDIAELFIQLYEPLCRYAFTIVKDSINAEDIVQGVFLVFIEKQETIDIKVAPRPYLYKMTHNAALNFLRKEATEKNHQLKSGTMDETVHPDSFSEDAHLALRKRVDEVMEKLPPQCRAVFIKSRAEQLKYSEIAELLGLSVKTVEAHMSKALKIIRGLLRVLLALVYLNSVQPFLNCVNCGI